MDTRFYNNLALITLLTWTRYGLTIEDCKDAPGSLELYISVPEHSFELNAHQEEMAGLVLAKRYRMKLAEMGVEPLTVKYKIRIGEYWTKEMADKAELDIRRKLYGNLIFGE